MTEHPSDVLPLEGHERVVKLLLQQEGVDPNRLDKHGGTPLSYATGRGHEGVVELLQARGSTGCADAQRPHLP